MDLNDFLLSILSGVVSSILIVNYVSSETERRRINDSISNLLEEIDFNRHKLPNFLVHITNVKNEWDTNNDLQWINHNEISTGYGGYLYNYFKFDTYNQFISSGSNLYLDGNFDNDLKLFYHKSKEFCAKTQAIEERMRRERAGGQNLVHEGLSQIEGEFYNISSIFENNQSFCGANKYKFQICWAQWHLERRRRRITSR
jgi:hypothetical protein